MARAGKVAGADEGQPAHRRADGGGGAVGDRPAHRAPHLARVRARRADLPAAAAGHRLRRSTSTRTSRPRPTSARTRSTSRTSSASPSRRWRSCRRSRRSIPKIPGTLDAAALCKMADRGQITGGILDGPLAFDNAISVEAARTKGIVSAVAGRRRHPAGAGPRGRQHARQAAAVPRRRRLGRHRARHARADRADLARRRGALAPRLDRGAEARRARPAQPPAGAAKP